MSRHERAKRARELAEIDENYIEAKKAFGWRDDELTNAVDRCAMLMHYAEILESEPIAIVDSHAGGGKIINLLRSYQAEPIGTKLYALDLKDSASADNEEK